MEAFENKANGINRKDGGQWDMIAFDNPDDALEDVPQQALGSDQSLVAVDSPDDFADESAKAKQKQ